jgi:hypothetical protein
LLSNMVAPLLVAIKGVHWAKDGPKFACIIDGCDASHTANYNLVWHLRMCHNATMELGKPGCPFTWDQCPRIQDHTVMNALILSNLLAWFHCNEQKVTVKVKRHEFLEWDRFQIDL